MFSQKSIFVAYDTYLHLMKKYSYYLFILFTLMACQKDNIQNNNPFIPNYSFTYTIDLSLPQYDNLKYPSNAMLITGSNVGANGLIVMNTGSTYVAFDANCPNQYITDCSRMTVKSIVAKCPCDNLEYDLFTGTSAGQKYSMKAYRVEAQANLIRIYN